jgi:hypothetical protein
VGGIGLKHDAVGRERAGELEDEEGGDDGENDREASRLTRFARRELSRQAWAEAGRRVIMLVRLVVVMIVGVLMHVLVRHVASQKHVIVRRAHRDVAGEHERGLVVALHREHVERVQDRRMVADEREELFAA